MPVLACHLSAARELLGSNSKGHRHGGEMFERWYYTSILSDS